MHIDQVILDCFFILTVSFQLREIGLTSAEKIVKRLRLYTSDRGELV